MRIPTNARTSTSANPSNEPPMTFHALQTIMRNFSDRTQAVPIAVAVHPDYLDVFIANLREEGFMKIHREDISAMASIPFHSIPIQTDPDVSFGRYKLVYADEKAS